MGSNVKEIKFRIKRDDSPELFDKLDAVKDGERSAYIRELLIEGSKSKNDQAHKEYVETCLIDIGRALLDLANKPAASYELQQPDSLYKGMAKQEAMLNQIHERLSILETAVSRLRWTAQNDAPSEAPKQEQVKRTPNYEAGETELSFMPEEEVEMLRNSVFKMMDAFDNIKPKN